MTRPSGYTGPTSGGFTIGPEGVTNRKRFYDEPLSRDERDAVAWFTELSPHEQLREVRRLKWNADERATVGLDGIQFQLSWAVPADGRGRGSMVRRGLARYPRRDWHDAPSLIKIKKIIRDGLPD